MNDSTLIGTIILATIFLGIVISLIVKKTHRKNSCSTTCTGCPHAATCPSGQTKNE